MSAIGTKQTKNCVRFCVTNGCKAEQGKCVNVTAIQYFLAVCQEGSFTQAARHCGVAQPSLSIALKRLETELGGRLFQRGPDKAKLTELGRILRPHFQAIDRSIRDVQRITKKRSSYSVSPIRIDLRDVKKVDDDQPITDFLIETADQCALVAKTGRMLVQQLNSVAGTETLPLSQLSDGGRDLSEYVDRIAQSLLAKAVEVDHERQKRETPSA